MRPTSRRQAAAAADVGERRLPCRGDADPAGRGRALRRGRPAGRLARPRRRPPAAATRRSPPHAAAATSSGSTTSRRCSSAGDAAPRRRAWRSSWSRATPRRSRSPTASFDAVLSVFGSMFAPNQQRAAAELARVVPPRRPDRPRDLDARRLHRRDAEGRGRRTSRRRPGVASPLLWGTEAYLSELFGDTICALRYTERIFTFRFRSAEAFVEYFRTLLRADAEGVRGRRCTRAGRALRRPRRARPAPCGHEHGPGRDPGDVARDGRDPQRVRRGRSERPAQPICGGRSRPAGRAARYDCPLCIWTPSSASSRSR